MQRTEGGPPGSVHGGVDVHDVAEPDLLDQDDPIEADGDAGHLGMTPGRDAGDGVDDLEHDTSVYPLVLICSSSSSPSSRTVSRPLGIEIPKISIGRTCHIGRDAVDDVD